MLLEWLHTGVAAKTIVYKCEGMLCLTVQLTLSRFRAGTLLYLIIIVRWRWSTWICTDINLLMKLLERERDNYIQQRVTWCDHVSMLIYVVKMDICQNDSKRAKGSSK